MDSGTVFVVVPHGRVAHLTTRCSKLKGKKFVQMSIIELTKKLTKTKKKKHSGHAKQAKVVVCSECKKMIG